MLCAPTGYFCIGCGIEDFDTDSHNSLRLYATRYFNAPAYQDSQEPDGREIRRDQFDHLFEVALTRQGWPILKYGKGVAVRRLLLVDEDGELSWGSRKDDGRARRTIPLSSIAEVLREPTPDAPAGSNPDAILCFAVSDGTGLKILCYSVCDAVVLYHGFKALIHKYKTKGHTKEQVNTTAFQDVAQ